MTCLLSSGVSNEGEACVIWMTFDDPSAVGPRTREFFLPPPRDRRATVTLLRGCGEESANNKVVFPLWLMVVS